MTQKEKIWINFVCSWIWPTTNLSDISLIQAIVV
ncbi:hypothetical protein Gotur_005372 [Gossypium turneri]